MNYSENKSNENSITLIAPNGNPSSNSYDPFNRLSSNTHREAGITEYQYDAQDRIIRVTAPNGVITQYEYDIISRRTKEISTDRGTITYTYDLANNVTSITEGRGITSTMTYDELERIKTKTYPNTITGKNENVSYVYDTCTLGKGYLCQRQDESGRYNYSYDIYGNVLSMQYTEQTSARSYTTAYQYDNGDNITQMTYPSGRVITYSRDGIRRIVGIDTTLNNQAQSIVSNITYRGDGQMLQCTYGNELQDTRTYDLQGRLLSQRLFEPTADDTLDQRAYSYDKNSNITSININGTETINDRSYIYDRLDRLTSDGVGEDDPMTYGYDPNDNRQTRKQGTGIDSIDEFIYYMEGSNRMDRRSIIKRGTGQIAVMPARTMTYNDVGRLYQLTESVVLKAEYIYNDMGQRTKKTLYQTDGITVASTTIYHYDSMGHLITETDLQGNLIKDYIWSSQMMPVAQIDNSSGTETITYLYTDHLMTNRLATSQSKTIIWRWEGEAFGNTPAQELSGVSINLRFPGQYYDSETNLHYNWNRYYDPTLGRYITSDPIGINGGMNTYGYAMQNPIMYTDPAGLAEPLTGGIALGLCAVGALGPTISLISGNGSLANVVLGCGVGLLGGVGVAATASAAVARIIAGITASAVGGLSASGGVLGAPLDSSGGASDSLSDILLPDYSSLDPVSEEIQRQYCEQNPQDKSNCQDEETNQCE